MSFTVHGSPSSHGSALFTCWQVPDGAEQLSSVHPLWSVQSLSSPETQWPPEQASPTVQPFPSSQGSVLLVWTQPPGVDESQESFVQGFRSSQFGAGPPTQTSFRQWSFVVHSLSSLRGARLFVVLTILGWVACAGVRSRLRC